MKLTKETEKDLKELRDNLILDNYNAKKNIFWNKMQIEKLNQMLKKK